MEHSALHAIQLTGILIALGGPFLVLALMRPVCRALGPDESRDTLARDISTSVARWVFCGALVAGLGTLADLIVQVAEVRGQTVLAGVPPALVVLFSTYTVVGKLCLARAGFLLLAAGAARLTSRHKWWLVAALALGAATCSSLVSHAAAQPTARLPVIASQVAHLISGALWIGVLIHLLAARQVIVAATSPGGIALVAGIVRRFSPIALTATALLGVSGLIAVGRFVGDAHGIFTSAYGLTLLVKLVLLVPVLYAGAMNYRVIRPALLALTGARAPDAAADEHSGGSESAATVLRRFGRFLELEVTAGVLVITVAGIVGSVSPPGEDGTLRLTSAQVHALLSPDLPTTAIVHPATFYGASVRGLDDLRYSEFMHNWSGVVVCLLGLCWLTQCAGGRAGRWAGSGWPFLLVPFAVFVAVASDPEVWWLRRVSWWQALRDPQLLEHQLGAVMILLLVWLGWREIKRADDNRPLGYALPVIMILGSLLLLGHAHSTLTVTEELTNLVNVQHAVFGAFGLLAGTVRWLSLRGLLPSRAARWVWPSLVVGLGLFMTFCYREVV
jgi:putative copper export protein